MVKFFPNDPNWLGRPRHHFTAWTVKNLFIIVFVGIVIAESVLYRRWARESDAYEWQNNHFWERIGGYLIPDGLLGVTMAYFVYTNSWHPIAALVFTIVCFSLWLTGAIMNFVFASIDDVYFKDYEQWQRLTWVEAAFQLAIATTYLVMMGYAAAAVHKLRMVKKAEEIANLAAEIVAKRMSVA